ncbi:transcriptional regulator [Pseudomonas sp. ABC1]|uniref:transcriptional regulator n=1 Tax=Pseudomonas sp. ABC1 TaxID=2748080 RepID=UPI00211A2440|nr:transcriptional regulator [Pseudomonas sp. ABC1]
MKFAERLHAALINAGYEPRPSVLEREFNLRYWGKPLTLHAVRRWLRGEALPTEDKMLVLAQWLRIDPQTLRFGDEVPERIGRENDQLAGLAHQERETLEAFLKLSHGRRKLVRDIILTFVQAEASKP